MSIFLLMFSSFLLLFWWLTRQGIKKNFFEVFEINPKLIFFFDSMYFVTLGCSVYYRYLVEPPGMMMTSMLRLNYFLMGTIWVFLLLTILNNGYFKFQDKKDKKKNSFNPERREFLKKKIALGSMGILGASTGVGLYHAISPEIEKVDLELPEKFKNLKGLKIAQLSDIHIGPTLKKEFLIDVVDKANQFEPDIIAITGDMVDGKVASLGKDLEYLRNLKAKLGVYFITGNHEYYWNASEWIKFVQDQGIRVLQNEHIILNHNNTSFALGGVNDLKAYRFGKEFATSPKKAIDGLGQDIYKILLAHQPISCYEAERVGWNLQLSGHTHGGQGFPWNILVSIIQPYLKGFYKHKTMDLYVNRGTGFWGPPYRLAIPGEVTHLTLV